MQTHNELRQNTPVFKNALERRQRILEAIIFEARETLDTLPQGRLRISRTGKYTTYYHKPLESAKSNDGQYIARANTELIGGLACREYLEKALAAAEKELLALQHLRPGAAEAVFDTLRPGLKALIRPLYMSDEDFIREWENASYKAKADAPGPETGFPTLKGEYVRSKSELIIADRLNQFGVPYKYECPLRIGGKIFYPDFTCLNVRLRRIIILEHFGMMGDADYLGGAIGKISFYEKNGLRLGTDIIYTMESSDVPFDIGFLESLIQNYLL